MGRKLVGANGEPDHVQIALPPSLELSRFVNNLKTASSRLLRKEFSEQLEKVYRKPVFWSGWYLHHFVWRRAALDLEAVHRAATKPRRVTPFTTS
jgi:REP element-mobilizing transposase RayT